MKFVTLLVIVHSEDEDMFKKAAKESGASGATVIQAKGSGVEEKSFFSLTFEGNHTILLYILEENISRSILKTLKVLIEDEKKDALAYTMPISSIVGLDKSLISKFEKNIEEEEVLS